MQVVSEVGRLGQVVIEVWEPGANCYKSMRDLVSCNISTGDGSML